MTQLCNDSSLNTTIVITATLQIVSSWHQSWWIHLNWILASVPAFLQGLWFFLLSFWAHFGLRRSSSLRSLSKSAWSLSSPSINIQRIWSIFIFYINRVIFLEQLTCHYVVSFLCFSSMSLIFSILMMSWLFSLSFSLANFSKSFFYREISSS